MVAVLATRLAVAHPTVAKALGKLEKAKLVRVHAYHGVTLTMKGKNLAHRCRQRHELLVRFLILLGVKARVAEQDAEGMEHHVSPATLKILTKKVSLWEKFQK